MDFRRFFRELSKRNVIKETIAYLIGAWVIVQVAAVVLPVFDSPEWILKSLTVFLISLIPFVIIFSWIYQITDQGIKKTVAVEGISTSESHKSRLNLILIIGSTFALILFIFIGSKFKSIDESQPFSIAILPFKNINLNDENESFIFGIREDIWQRLARIEGINIRSNRSAEAKETIDKPNKDIAKLLNSKYLVEGIATKHGDRIELNISIWDDQDNLINQKTYDNAFKQPFKLQKELARSIVEAIKFNLSKKETAILEFTGTNNLEAFLKVKEGEKKVADNEEIDAIYDFKDALKHDSTYADAYGNLAYAYSMLCWKYTDNHITEVKNLKHYSQKALELDPDNGRALLALGAFYDVIKNNDSVAESFFNRAMKSIPNDPHLYFEKGLFAYFSRPQKLDDAVTFFTKALEIEPLEWQYSRSLMQSLAANGRYHDAIDVLQKTAYLFPIERFPKPTQFWAAELACHKDGNRNAKLKFLKNQAVLDSLNPFWFTEIGIHYDCYLNDDRNFLKYSKKAFELDSGLIDHYITALIDNYKFEEAKKMIQSASFSNLSPSEKRIRVLNNYYSSIGDFNSLKDLIDTTYLAKDSLNYIWYQIKSGKITELEKIGFKNYSQLSLGDKAIMYAMLQNRDSMYYYLSDPLAEAFLKRVPSVDPSPTIHNNHAFDPYREEPRYKAFKKRFYLE